MKVGDLVKLDPEVYTREKGCVGQLLDRAPVHFGERWIVMINDRVHPYFINEKDMEVVSAGR